MTDMTSPADAKVGLLPCPFCGKVPLIVCPDNSYGSAMVTCGDDNKCPVDLTAWGDLNTGETLEDAIAAWNTRAALEEAILGVGDGSGQLFVHGSYEAIKRVQKMIFDLEQLSTPIAPVQDDELVRRLRTNAAYLAKHDDGICRLEADCLSEAADRIANRPTADHSLVEALLDIRSAYESEREDGVVVEEIGRILRREAVLLIGKQSADDRG